MSVTDVDRKNAIGLVESAAGIPWDVFTDEHWQQVDRIATALAAEREKARAPFRALADELEREATVIAVRAGVPPLDFVRLWRDDAPARIRRAAEDS